MRIKTQEDYDFLMSACNGAALARSLLNLFTDLLKNTDTDDRNKHPEVRAYLLKLSDLAGLTTDIKDYEDMQNHFDKDNQ